MNRLPPKTTIALVASLCVRAAIQRARHTSQLHRVARASSAGAGQERQRPIRQRIGPVPRQIGEVIDGVAVHDSLSSAVRPAFGSNYSKNHQTCKLNTFLIFNQGHTHRQTGYIEEIRLHAGNERRGSTEIQGGRLTVLLFALRRAANVPIFWHNAQTTHFTVGTM